MKDLSKRSSNVAFLMARELYTPAAKECLTLIEFALREFIIREVSKLPIRERQAVQDYEKEKGKGQRAIDAFTMGELVGLLRHSKFFDVWSAATGIDLAFTKIINLDNLTNLRNDLLHEKRQKEASKGEAELLQKVLSVVFEDFGILSLEKEAPNGAHAPPSSAIPQSSQQDHELRSPRIVQGVVGWDFDGNAYTDRSFTVMFTPSFPAPPIIQTSIIMMDLWSEDHSSTQIWCEATDISASNAVIKAGSWHKTKIAGIKIQWIAFGQ